MATFFISMIFSGVIPILVPVTLISFVLLYFADKLLFFKYYQTPIQYRPKLHKAFLSFLYISVMLHFGLTAFFLAEPSLIASGAYFGSYSSVSSGSGRVDNMFRTGYILPYSIMFILMLVYAVFQRCIGGVLSACMDQCKGRLGNYKSTMVQKMKLMNIMSPEQRASLRLALEVNLRKLELKRKERARSMTDLLAANTGKGKGGTIRES